VPFDADNFMGILDPAYVQGTGPSPCSCACARDSAVARRDHPEVSDEESRRRYATMAALLQDLEKVERGETPAALGEMMARSGGFNIPATTFARARCPPRAGDSGWRAEEGQGPLLIAMGAVATLGIAALAVTLARPTSTRAEGIVISALPPTPPPPASRHRSPPRRLPRRAVGEHVAVVIEPLDAKVVREGESGNLNVTRASKRSGSM